MGLRIDLAITGACVRFRARYPTCPEPNVVILQPVAFWTWTEFSRRRCRPADRFGGMDVVRAVTQTYDEITALYVGPWPYTYDEITVLYVGPWPYPKPDPPLADIVAPTSRRILLCD